MLGQVTPDLWSVLPVDRMFGERIKPQPQSSKQSVQNGEQSLVSR